MVLDLNVQGLNMDIAVGKKFLTKKDVPTGMFKKYLPKVDLKDDIVRKDPNIFVNRTKAPCPRGACRECFFGAPCLNETIPLMVDSLEHLYSGGKLTWINQH